MRFEYQIRVLATVWVLAAIAMTVFASTGPTMAWLAASVLGLGPAIVMMRLAKEQPQTLSQSIQEARR
jgi:hypothetical protein